MKGTFIVSIICMALAVTFAATLEMQLEATHTAQSPREEVSPMTETSTGYEDNYEVSQVD